MKYEQENDENIRFQWNLSQMGMEKRSQVEKMIGVTNLI